MDKKDIYEHLAKIYLDASDKKNKKGKRIPNRKNIFVFGIILVAGVSVFLFSALNKNRPAGSETALYLVPDIAKINFNFDPAKQESYSLDLKKLDLGRYKTLSFSVKKSSQSDTIALKLEFTSSFKEHASIYLKDIPVNWREYKISLSDFKNITDWSNMSKVSFIIEEWNTRVNNGIVYLENIRFLR